MYKRQALNPNKFASKAKIIQIDIDPSELGKNVDVDLAPVSYTHLDVYKRQPQRSAPKA